MTPFPANAPEFEPLRLNGDTTSPRIWRALIPTFVELKKEFEDTLGFIRNDIRWLITHDGRVNYTVALLVGCGCEMLAACRDPKNRLGEKVFVELLPDGDWQVLAKHLYTALRDGLAHGFDTKHIIVDGKEHQISFHWDEMQVIRVLPSGTELGIRIGPRVLAQALCAKITEFEAMLRTDETARQRSWRPASDLRSSAGRRGKRGAGWLGIKDRASIAISSAAGELPGRP